MPWNPTPIQVTKLEPQTPSSPSVKQEDNLLVNADSLQLNVGSNRRCLRSNSKPTPSANFKATISKLVHKKLNEKSSSKKRARDQQPKKKTLASSTTTSPLKLSKRPVVKFKPSSCREEQARAEVKMSSSSSIDEPGKLDLNDASVRVKIASRQLKNLLKQEASHADTNSNNEDEADDAPHNEVDAVDKSPQESQDPEQRRVLQQ